MAEKHRQAAQGAVGPGSLDEEAKAFAASLKRRGEAAQGLEKDLLHEVPLLYGSPGGQPYGDPGIVLAKIHREELVRRNGGGVPDPPNERSYAVLPFERTITAIIVLFVIIRLSGVLD